jgi:hypothetical protein
MSGDAVVAEFLEAFNKVIDMCETISETLRSAIYSMI